MSESILPFKHKNCYVLSGEHFAVEITRHSVDIALSFDGGQRWCVYAYIHPKHPFFKIVNKIDPDDYFNSMYSLEVNNLLHGGCTYFVKINQKSYKMNNKYIKFGADYNHYEDKRFTFYKDLYEAFDVHDDAKRLYDYLNNY